MAGNKDQSKGVAGYFDDLESGSAPPSAEPIKLVAKSHENDEPTDQPSDTDRKQRKSDDRQTRQSAPAFTSNEVEPDATPAIETKRKRAKTAPAEQTLAMPTGRPPGKIDPNAKPKAKASLYVDRELLDEYRERVFIERRRLGELIAEAMEEYRGRHWKEGESSNA